MVASLSPEDWAVLLLKRHESVDKSRTVPRQVRPAWTAPTDVVLTVRKWDPHRRRSRVSTLVARIRLACVTREPLLAANSIS